MPDRRVVGADRAEVFHFSNLNALGEPSPGAEHSGGPGSEEKKERDLNEIEREAFEKGFAAGERSGMKMAERRIEVALKRFSKSLQEVARLRARARIISHFVSRSKCNSSGAKWGQDRGGVAASADRRL